MVLYLKFDSDDPGKISNAGLDFAALSRIILGPQDMSVPPCMAGAPGWARAFIAREYRAAEFTFMVLDDSEMHAANPLDGRPARCAHSFIAHMPDGRPAVFALFAGGPVFGLAFAGLAGRVTHVYVPRLDCIVYDLDANLAPAVYGLFQKHLETLVMPPVFKRPCGPRVGVVSMVRNYAHELLNSLSGLQRLVDSGRTAALQEVWMSGAGFFGPPEELFPELAGKFSHADPAQLKKKAGGANSIVSIGSNMVTAGLRARILRYGKQRYPVEPAGAGRWPLVAFTVRAGERRCLNLPEVIERICSGLQAEFPNLGIILDGWVTAERETGPAPKPEIDLSELVASRLPPGLVVANLVGMPILKSISLLGNIDTYVAHIGTLQHKLAWFSLAKGIVHGPHALLAAWDGGAYSSELGFPLQLSSKEAILDRPSAHPRGAAAYDYEIIDTSGMILTIMDILRDARRGQEHAESTMLSLA